MSCIPADLYGEIIGYVRGWDRVVGYLASVAKVRDDWGITMSLAFSGGFNVDKFVCVWERSGEVGRQYLLQSLGRRHDVDFDLLRKKAFELRCINLSKVLFDFGCSGDVDLLFIADEKRMDFWRFFVGCGFRGLLRDGVHSHGLLKMVSSVDFSIFISNRTAFMIGFDVGNDFDSGYYYFSFFRNDSIDIFRALIKCYLIDIDATVHEAIVYNACKIVRYIVSMGVDLNKVDFYPLYEAVQNAGNDLSAMIVDFGFDDESVFEAAVNSGYVEMVVWAAKMGYVPWKGCAEEILEDQGDTEVFSFVKVLE